MDRTIRFRATNKEYEKLKKLAGNTNMSDYIRSKLFKEEKEVIQHFEL